MRKLIPLLLLALAGCSTPNQPEIGRADIHVPKMFHADSGWIDRAPSQHERYLQMFREGYWDCINRYVESIDYVPKASDSYANGWMSEVAGYSDGYFAAMQDVQKNIMRFGKQRTAAYLKSIAAGGL